MFVRRCRVKLTAQTAGVAPFHVQMLYLGIALMLWNTKKLAKLLVHMCSGVKQIVCIQPASDTCSRMSVEAFTNGLLLPLELNATSDGSRLSLALITSRAKNQDFLTECLVASVALGDHFETVENNPNAFHVRMANSQRKEVYNARHAKMAQCRTRARMRVKRVRGIILLVQMIPYASSANWERSQHQAVATASLAKQELIQI